MTTRTTAEALRAKIKAALASKEKLAAEVAELERAAKWAEGNERRERLTKLAEQAHQLSEQAGARDTAIQRAADTVTTALRDLAALVDRHNTQLGELRTQIAAEGVRDSFTPPSPADGGVGVNRDAIIIGETHLIPIDGQHLARAAVDAAQQPDATATVPTTVKSKPLTGARYWINDSTGSTFASDGNDLYGCREITQIEYLAANWGLRLAELPSDLLDQLTDRERARLAEQLLPADAS